MNGRTFEQQQFYGLCISNFLNIILGNTIVYGRVEKVPTERDELMEYHWIIVADYEDDDDDFEDKQEGNSTVVCFSSS